MKLSENSRYYTTFNTPFGMYAYDRMSYGVCSSPENIDGVNVYLNDHLVWGSNEEEHDRRLAEVQKRVL